MNTCHDCSKETNNLEALTYPDKSVSVCEVCKKKHWVCERCHQAVYPNDMDFLETHENCGGECH